MEKLFGVIIVRDKAIPYHGTANRGEAGGHMCGDSSGCLILWYGLISAELKLSLL